MYNEEIFIPIIGYENNYKISNFGNVLSIKRNKILKPSISKGYFVIGLSLNSKLKVQSIHRLVALHFIPNPNNYLVVNHKDGNKLNYAIENLEWCTDSQNMKHAYRTGLIPILRGSKHGNSKLTEEKVLEIRNKFNIENIEPKNIAKIYGVTTSAIIFIVNKVTWKHI